jgi:hypothetical protein
MEIAMKRAPGFAAGLFAALVVAVTPGRTQPQLPAPDASPKAFVTQTIGIADVQVSYHRPGVKGRNVWGALVPYGEVWRAGANENTTISFSLPVSVSGKPLPAGTYGIHMIPGKGDWIVIFNRNSTSWGSFFYKESEDALRITVSPRQGPRTEWLEYDFSDLTDSSGVLAMHWDTLVVPIPLAFETRGLVLAAIRDSYLRGLAGFGWQGLNNAALFCARNDVNLAEALGWADKSIALNENYANLTTKALLLEKSGKKDEAAALRERSLKLATEADLNQLGYTYLAAGKNAQAIEVFEKNVKAHPASWNVYDSLAEAREKSGDTKAAIAGYERALSIVKDEANRKRITDTIAKLKAR